MGNPVDVSKDAATPLGRAPRAREWLSVAIEFTSLAGALSFVFSALIHEWAFRVQLNRSYIEFASLEDVVLGGLRLFVLLLGALPLVFAGSTFALVFWLSVIAGANRSGWRGVALGVTFGSLLALPFLISVMATNTSFATSVFYSLAFGWWPAAIWIYCSGYDRNVRPFANVRSTFGPYLRMFLFDLTTPTIAIIIIVLAVIAVHDVVALTDDLATGRGSLLNTDQVLTGIKCKASRLIWVGSATAIFECDGKMLVAKNPEHLVYASTP
jgi:hypothetical protein